MLNNLTIMGRIVADPEIKNVGNNIPVANFRIAVDSDFKDGNGNKKTAFLDCQAWRNTANYIGKYFRKGRMIIIQGHLDTQEWEKDGQKHSRVIIVVDNAYFGDSKKEDGQGAPAGNNPSYGAQQGGYAPAPQQGGYGAPQGGYAPAPQQGGYGAPGGYAPAPQQGGYGAPQGGYAPAPQQGGYGAPGGYATPNPPGNFAMLEDDDAQLPF